jgi:hypothetical protein
VNWAIVIGIDEYDSEELRLNAAVSDAERFCDWVTAPDRGNVPQDQLKLLLGRSSQLDQSNGAPRPTKDNIVTVINDVVTAAGDNAERLYFYFSGHGITARVSNRDESALVTPGFDEIHTDHSLAIRSLTEHFETTPFKDQFFFLDACRNIPWTNREFEIGRWPIPRQRDPGTPPVQQFILYATSPGLKAQESPWEGAFTGVLMDALEGHEAAKAWSWERNCYEVRWERLAGYVNDVMSKKKRDAQKGTAVAAEDVPYQIPQDTGSRGVADRDRDALLVSFPQGHFPSLELIVDFELEPPYKRADMDVLDAVGQPVVSALRVGSGPRSFTLPPKTYAVRAVTSDKRIGVLQAPIELYRNSEKPEPLIELPARAGAPSDGGVKEAVGSAELEHTGQNQTPAAILIKAQDPLAAGEIRDEAGFVHGVIGSGTRMELPPGFYRVNPFGPERNGTEQFVVLGPGEHETVRLKLPRATRNVAALAKALGVSRAVWAQPSTHVAAAVGTGLQGNTETWEALGLAPPRKRRTAVAFLAVVGDGDDEAFDSVRVRIWQSGNVIPNRAKPLTRSQSVPGLAGVVLEVKEAEPHWLAVEVRGKPTVLALPMLPNRLATVVAQVDADRVRAFQFHPAAESHGSSTPERLREVEYLERQLLSGRLDGADALARKLAEAASDDPFAGCVAGYVLLRLGHQKDKELERLAAAITAAAPTLSDAYILRGEFEAANGRPEAARQAFIDAVSAGIPVFGEGLTRLLEGLRANGFVHPRAALVRHIFQRHVQGSMWAAFVPRRNLKARRLVITGADVGFEG